MPTEAKDGPVVATLAFGRHLLQERELRGLSREEVSRLTKLAPGVIDALESGEPERMPPRAYLVGYLRSYAAAVGLDPDEVVLRWQEVAGPVQEPPPKRRSRGGKKIALVVLVIVTALAALALLTIPRLAGNSRSTSGDSGSTQQETAPNAPRP